MSPYAIAAILGALALFWARSRSSAQVITRGPDGRLYTDASMRTAYNPARGSGTSPGLVEGPSPVGGGYYSEVDSANRAPVPYETYPQGPADYAPVANDPNRSSAVAPPPVTTAQSPQDPAFFPEPQPAPVRQEMSPVRIALPRYFDAQMMA